MSPDPVRTRTGSGLVPGVGGRRVWGRIVRTLERFRGWRGGGAPGVGARLKCAKRHLFRPARKPGLGCPSPDARFSGRPFRVVQHPPSLSERPITQLCDGLWSHNTRYRTFRFRPSGTGRPEPIGEPATEGTAPKRRACLQLPDFLAPFPVGLSEGVRRRTSGELVGCLGVVGVGRDLSQRKGGVADNKDYVDWISSRQGLE